MKIERTTEVHLKKMALGRYLLIKAAHKLAPLWVRLGVAESWLLHRRLQRAGTIDRPIFVCGMARAGTTIMLDLLSRHPEVACHRYRDMAQPFMPYVWNRLLDKLPLPMDQAVDRIHHDGILVTRNSPEAVEEAIWNQFFPALHDESQCAVLTETTRHPAFEACYAATISKLVLAQGRTRYLSKANYNLTRMAYIARLFPQARFIVPVREPEAHFVSWVKQHRLFLDLQQRDPRWHRAVKLVGHHEFGLDQRFVNTGDPRLMHDIRRNWDNERHARAFGLYWSAMYGHVLDLADRSPALQRAIRFVHYEEFCARPKAMIDAILSHVELDVASFWTVRDEYAMKLKLPDYYQATLTAAERRDIEVATRDVARRLGLRKSARGRRDAPQLVHQRPAT